MKEAQTKRFYLLESLDLHQIEVCAQCIRIVPTTVRIATIFAQAIVECPTHCRNVRGVQDGSSTGMTSRRKSINPCVSVLGAGTDFYSYALEPCSVTVWAVSGSALCSPHPCQ